MSYFKVTDHLNGSCCTFGELRILYRPREWILPPVGKLFVFDSRTAAELFSIQGQKIWECSVENPVVATKCCWSCDSEVLSEFWKHPENFVSPGKADRLNSPQKIKANCPGGTIFGDAVKLTKLIRGVY